MRFHVVLPLALALLTGCAATAESPQVAFSRFDGDFLVAVDTDMPAFAYANGELLPRQADPDFVALVRGGGEPAIATRIAASNSVTTWPGAIAVSPDGRFAYVIEGREPPAPSVDKVESIEVGLSAGQQLTVLAIARDGLRRIAVVDTSPLATGVAVSPDGRTLAVTTETAASDVQFFRLVDGIPQAPFAVDLAPQIGIGNRVGRVEGIAWHTSGDLLAVNLGSGGVGLVDVTRAGDGSVTSAALRPAPVTVGKLLSGLHWAPDGRHLYALDTGWGPNRTDRVFNGPGAIHVIAAVPGEQPNVVQSIATGLSSESFAISRDGSLIATLNMERTYLPGGGLTGMIAGRDASSASLFAVDAASGRLRALGPSARFSGVLPQGIAFDNAGNNLAVAVFQDHAAASLSGWVQFLTIVGTGDGRRLEVTDRRIPMPRGAHYIAALPPSR